MLELPENPSSLRPTQLMDLRLPTAEVAYEQIFNIGMEMAPEEACGILVREDVTEFRVIQLRNRAEDPTAMYRLDVSTLRQLALRPESWKHVAVWHTHPGGQVGPSAGDLEHKVNGVQYLVVTLPTGEVVKF